MDIMDTAVYWLLESAEVLEEEDMPLLLKVINLKSKQKELVTKVLDASDQCQDTIDMILSSTNTTLDVVQKIIRANTEDLNLMRKITELNNKEWDLVRKGKHLCDGKRYFVHKFMDWYLSDENLDFPCSCSGIKGVEHVGKDGTRNVKKCNSTVGKMHTAVSSYASQQGSSSENIRTHLTNQGTSTEKLDKSCRENGFSLCKTDTCTENRSVAKEVNLTEKDRSSAGYNSEEVAQPAMIANNLLCYEHLCSDSSQSSEDVCENFVSHIEHNDLGCQLKTTKQSDDGRDKGNLTSTVTVLCGTSDSPEGVTHEERLLSTKSSVPLYENTAIREEQTLVCGTNHNWYAREMKESVQELSNASMKQTKTPLLPEQNMDTEVHEQQIYNESLQGNVSHVLTSALSAVASGGIQSQNYMLNDCYFPVRGRTETQLDQSGKLFINPREEFVLKDCYVRLENMAYVLRDKKTVNLKDLESPQGDRMKKSISKNEASDVPDCGIKGSINVSLNKKREKDTRQRRYVNNAKKRRTQTSEDLGFQDAVVKEKMVVEGHSEFEDLECDKEKTCSGFSTDTANNKYQNLSSKNLSTVKFACNGGMPEDTRFTGEYRHHQHRVPEIQNPEVVCREEGCYQSVGNVQKGNAAFLGKVAFHEGSAGKCVEETSNSRIRVKPEFNERTGMLWRSLSGEAEKTVGEKENILGIQLRPFSLERVGSLKWMQFTTYIDHPYAEEVNVMCTQQKYSSVLWQ